MYTKRRTGTTTENNAWTLPQGMLSIDSEKRALRIHDGQTPGGYEVVGTRAYTPPDYGPGPQELVAGDMTEGFFGEVTGDELITYGELSTAMGIAEGTLMADSSSIWLKFALDEKVLYFAKHPIRQYVSWHTLYQSGVIYGDSTVGNYPSGAEVVQDATLNTHGSVLKVRVPHGARMDPADVVHNEADPEPTHGSEWNRLMYRVSSTVPPSQAGANWAEYSYGDLGLSYYSHTQETISSSLDSRVFRGYTGSGVDGVVTLVATENGAGWRYMPSWRPVLELIQ